MVLIEVFRRLRPLHKMRISVLHVHHGQGSAEQTTFRNQAREIVKEYCRKNHLHFLTNTTPPSLALKSEDDFRRFRLRCYSAAVKLIRKNWPNRIRLLTAHHRDDVLETRLLQLLRGAGVQGFLQLHGLQEGRFLPLYPFSKSDLLAYAKERSLQWLEDPTNADTDALRNWLRHNWLADLEKRKPGAQRQLALSLEKLAAEVQESFQSKLKQFQTALSPNGQVLRHKLSHWPFEMRAAFWAWYFKTQGLKSYSSNHVFEMLKRLDTTKKEFRFELIGRRWVVDAQHIWMNPQASNL